MLDDESNVLEYDFLERMKSPAGKVLRLFQVDKYGTLMTECKEGAQRNDKMFVSAK